MQELVDAHGSSDGTTPPDPEPVHHLRRFSNYLAPRVGLLSSDTWALVAIFLRNLLVNWLMLVPYMALVLLVPIFSIDLLYALSSEPHGFWGKLQPAIYAPGRVRWLGLVCLAAVAFSSAMLNANLPGSRIASLTKAAPALSKKVGEGMSGRGFIVAVLIPLTAAAVGLVSYWFLVMTAQAGSLPAPSWRTLVCVGVAVHLLGFGIYSALVLRSRGTETPLRLAQDTKMLLLDLAAVVVSGAFAGWLVWILGTSTLPLFAQALGGLTSLDFVHAYVANFVVIALPMLLGAFLFAMTVYVAMASRCRTDDDREWYARAGSWVLAVGVGWLCLSAVGQFGPLLIRTTTRVTAIAAINFVSGALTWWLGRSGATSGRPAKGQQSVWRTETGLAAASGVFVVAFTLLLAFGLTELRDFLVRTWTWQPATATLVIAAGLAGEILLMMTVNTNVFSLHAMYRDRLIRAYLGASRNGRRENRFTHFDPYDNLPLAYLAPPFFGVRDWQEVHAIASRLEPAAERAEVDEVDPDLIGATVSVKTMDRAAVARLVERWNDLLSRLENPAKFRARWTAMLQPAYAATLSGVHGATAVLETRQRAQPRRRGGFLQAGRRLPRQDGVTAGSRGQSVRARRHHRRVAFGDQRAVAASRFLARQSCHTCQLARDGHARSGEEAPGDLAQGGVPADPSAQRGGEAAGAERPEIRELRLVVDGARDHDHRGLKLVERPGERRAIRDARFGAQVCGAHLPLVAEHAQDRSRLPP